MPTSTIKDGPNGWYVECPTCGDVYEPTMPLNRKWKAEALQEQHDADHARNRVDEYGYRPEPPGGRSVARSMRKRYGV